MKYLTAIILVVTILTSCSKDSETVDNINAPDNLQPSEYSNRNSNDGNSPYLYLYFGVPDANFSGNLVSSNISQFSPYDTSGLSSISNAINYTYNKPNGSIAVGPVSYAPNANLNTPIFKEGETYPFSINGNNLTITINGTSVVLVKSE